jgi:hypothetical protein
VLPQKTRPVGWVFRAMVTVHVVVVVALPVFAGVYLSGDYDSLGRHALAADVATVVGYLQLAVAIAVWVRLRTVWPLVATVLIVTAETAQYFAGLDGALWLHIPLGVMIVAALVVQFISVWSHPLTRRVAVDA